MEKFDRTQLSSFVSPSTQSLKKKRKPVKKKDKIMFSYQSVAHIPKIRQI